MYYDPVLWKICSVVESDQPFLIQLTQDKDHWRAIVGTVMNISVS
jgi:hypothetical protein